MILVFQSSCLIEFFVVYISYSLIWGIKNYNKSVEDIIFDTNPLRIIIFGSNIKIEQTYKSFKISFREERSLALQFVENILLHEDN